MKGPMRPCGLVASGLLFLMSDPCPYLQPKEKGQCSGKRKAEDGEGGVGDGRTLVLRSRCGLESLRRRNRKPPGKTAIADPNFLSKVVRAGPEERGRLLRE